MTIAYDSVESYDGGTVFVARPVTPGYQAPPYALVTVTSPGLGDDWGGYNIDRQVVRSPAAPLERIGQIRPRLGRSRSDAEAQHRWFADRESGWVGSDGGRIGDGVNYWVTYLDRNGIESVPTRAGAQVIVPATGGSWLTCNAAWWLQARLRVIPEISTALGNRSFVWEVAGRDYEVTRTKRGKPSKRASGTIMLSEHVGHDQARILEAIAASGRQVCLSRKLGDRFLGTLQLTGYDDHAAGRLNVGFEFISTGALSIPSDYNLPAGLVLDGTDDLISTPDHADLDPGTGSWSWFFAGADLTWASGDYMLSKGQVSAEDGYALRCTATTNEVEAVIRDGATTKLATATIPWLFDDFGTAVEGHVLAGSYDSSAETLTLWADGVLQATTPAAGLGDISNTRRLFAGANNDGADAGANFLTGLYRAHGVYPRALTAVEHARLACYLRGTPGVRAPGNANVFYDARDNRSLTGVDDTLRDLGGLGHDATLVGSPVTRGNPAPLGTLEDA